MPIYEYKCTCGARFETLQGFDEPKLKKCNKDIHECSEEGELTRLISKPTLLKLGHLSDKKLSTKFCCSMVCVGSFIKF